MTNKKPLTTTLERIRNHQPCKDGWEELLKGLGKTKGDDEPLPYSKIVEINGIEYALCCCRAEPKYDREWRLFAVWCARQVQHLMTDQRSIEAINVAERFANGEATKKELAAARYGEYYDAEVTAWTTAEAFADDAAWNAVRNFAWDAIWNDSRNVELDTKRAAVIASTWNDAWNDARKKQKQKFLEVVGWN